MVGSRLLPLCLCLVFGCEEPLPENTEWPRIEVIDTMDPDLSDRTDPGDGLIIWVSTYAGTVRFLTAGRQIVGPLVVPGGELTITEIPPTALEPGSNTIDIRLQPTSGGQELVAQVSLVVSAQCTMTDDCPTAHRCDAFECVPF
jgi:hypothetical protein